MSHLRLEGELDELAAEIDFAGVVRVDQPDHETFAKAYGFAHRGYAVPNTVETRLAVASMTKGFTALAVVSLIEDGTIELGTTARSLLRDDLQLVAEDVTRRIPARASLGHRRLPRRGAPSGRGGVRDAGAGA